MRLLLFLYFRSAGAGAAAVVCDGVSVWSSVCRAFLGQESMSPITFQRMGIKSH